MSLDIGLKRKRPRPALAMSRPSLRSRVKGVFAALLAVAAVGTFGSLGSLGSLGSANAHALGALAGAPVPGSQGVVVWLASSFNGGNSAIAVGLCNVGGAGQLRMNASTDRGSTWITATANGLPTTGFFDDRPYLWTDHNPSSPFFGRTYLTEAV